MPIRNKAKAKNSKAQKINVVELTSNNELFLSDAYQSELTDLVTGHKRRTQMNKNPYLHLDVTSDEMGDDRFRSRLLQTSKGNGSVKTNNSKTSTSWIGPRDSNQTKKSSRNHQLSQLNSDQQETDIETRQPLRKRPVPPKFPFKRFLSQN